MRFIDEEYDGLMVKLPNWFIELNGLETIITEFKKTIEEKATMSLMFGDYVHSLYELENYKSKKVFAKDKLEKKKITDKKIEEYYKPRINKEIFDLEWKEQTTTPNQNQIILGSAIFDEEYFWSNGKTPNRKRIQEVNTLINKLSDDDYKEFIESNYILTVSNFVYGTHWRRVDSTVYMDIRGFIFVRVEKLTIKWWANRTEYYERLFIQQHYKNKENYFMLPTKKGGEISLNDYDIKENLLIKKLI